MNLNVIIEKLKFLKVDIANNEKTTELIGELNVILWEIQEFKKDYVKFMAKYSEEKFNEIAPHNSKKD